MTRTAEEILGKKAIAAVRRPVEKAGGLPGAAYTSQEFFELEQEQFFPRTWMGVGFECDIPKPGDAMPIMVGKLPIILVRNKTGQIKAFHNVCRHRATLVLTEPGKGLTSLTCPYHAWAYDLDGKLKAIPYFDGTKNGRNTDLDWSKYGLVPVRCAVWQHWIFVNMDGNAPSIEQHVASIAELLDGYDIGATNVGHREDWEFRANWKLQNDNWETYHHVWVHKGFFSNIGFDLDLVDKKPWTRPVQAKHLVTLIRGPGAPGYGQWGDTNLPLIPITPNTVRQSTISIIFPNVAVTVSANHIVSIITEPLAPDRTIAKQAFFFVGDAAHDRRHARPRKNILDMWLGVSRSPKGRDGLQSQDFGIWEAQQIARQSPVADKVLFSPVWEGNIHHFHNELIDHLIV